MSFCAVNLSSRPSPFSFSGLFFSLSTFSPAIVFQNPVGYDHLTVTMKILIDIVVAQRQLFNDNTVIVAQTVDKWYLEHT